MRIRTVFYDIGNVLFHFDFTKALRRFSSNTGLKPDELQEIFDGSGLPELYEKGRCTSSQFYRKVLSLTGIRMGYRDFCKAFCAIFTENHRETARMRRLKRRCRVFLLSNTNELHYEHLQSSYPALRHVDGAVLSYRVGARKPEPEIFLAAMKIAGARPETCLFIDDIEENVEAARALGIRAIRYQAGRET